QMPVMNGYTASEEIRKNEIFRDLPIIALTADVMSDLWEKATSTGMDDCVTKPINPDVLFKTLVRCIRPRQRQLPASYLNRQHAPVKEKDMELFPQIATVDALDGIRRIGGDANRYRQLLAKFIDSQREFGSWLDEAMTAKDERQARQLVHTLRGVAGNIGATNLHEKAVQTEDLLKKEDRDQGWNAVAELITTFQNTYHNIQAALARKQQWAKEGTGGVSQESLLSLMDSLWQLLLDSDTRARNVLEDIQQKVTGGPFEEDFARVARHVSNYDNDKALVELNRIYETFKQGQ
ncbi:MAG: Hpt domain-containing protein, partial [Desulfopila sp.]